jgi:hypothetical protein
MCFSVSSPRVRGVGQCSELYARHPPRRGVNPISTALRQPPNRWGVVCAVPMFRLPLLLAGFGLAIEVMLWSLPGLAAASGLPRPVGQERAIPLYTSLQRAQDELPSDAPFPSALVALLSAEAEALHVAAEGLRQPPPEDLSAQATHAGLRVESAVRTYAGSVRSVLGRT